MDSGHYGNLALGSLDIAASGKKAPKILNDFGERKITPALLIHVLESDMGLFIETIPSSLCFLSSGIFIDRSRSFQTRLLNIWVHASSAKPDLPLHCLPRCFPNRCLFRSSLSLKCQGRSASHSQLSSWWVTCLPSPAWCKLPAASLTCCA